MLALICLWESCAEGEANEFLKRKGEKAISDYTFNRSLDSLIANKEFSNARKLTGQRLNEFPSDKIFLITKLGTIYKAEGAIDSAMEKFNEVINLDRKNASMLVQRGWMFVQSNELEKAIADFENASKINTDVFFDLGFAQEKNGRYVDAINSYSEYLKIHPQSNSSKNRIVKLEAKLKQAGE